MDGIRQRNKGLAFNGTMLIMAEKPEHEPERRARYLTDQDVEKLAEVFEERISKRLYIGVGKGIVRLIWRGIVLGLVALAAYGFGKGFKF